MKDGQSGQREGVAKLPGEDVQAADDRTRTQYMVEDKLPPWPKDNVIAQCPLCIYQTLQFVHKGV